MCIYIYIYIYIIPICLNGGFLKVGITQIPQPLWSSVQEIAARVEAAVQDDSQAGAAREMQHVWSDIYELGYWSTMVWIYVQDHIETYLRSGVFICILIISRAFSPPKLSKYKGHTSRSASFDWRTVRHWQSRLEIGCCKSVPSGNQRWEWKIHYL